MLTVHRPANTTQPSPPSPLQASLSTLLPAHPHSQERDNNPPSASVGLCLSYPWSDRISEKSCWSPIQKKTSIACPAFIATLPTAGKELCIYLFCFVFYEGDSCHVWTRRPVGCCKTRHAEVLKSDTSVDSSSSRRRRLVCRDCGAWRPADSLWSPEVLTSQVWCFWRATNPKNKALTFLF